MNLYRVTDWTYDWCCFTFDTTRNKAKLAVAKEFDIDYVDMRCKTLVKDVKETNEPSVVYSEDHKDYPIVKKLGYKYDTPEEYEEWVDSLL